MGCQKALLPSFLVTVTDHHLTQELMMPTGFIKHLNENIPFDSILKTSSSARCWCIEVESEGENLFFRKGWSEFVQEYFLEFGDSIAFMYNGNSQFYVKVYGKNGFKKEFNSSKAKGRFTKSHTNFEHTNGETSRGVSVIRNENICGSCKYATRRTAVENERTETIEAPSTFEEETPYFILSWKQEMKYHAEIPGNFLREVGEELSDIVFLEDPVGREWCIGLGKADGRVWFQRDWTDFIEHQSICDHHFLYFRYCGNSHFYVFTLSNISAFEMMHLDDYGHREEPNLNRRCQSKNKDKSKPAYGTKLSCNRKRRLSPSSSERLKSRYRRMRRGDDEGKVREISGLGESNQAAKPGSNERSRSIGHEEKEMSSDEPLDDLEESNQDKQASEESSSYQGNESPGSNEHEWIDVDFDESPSVAEQNACSRSSRAMGKHRAKLVANSLNSQHPFFTTTIRGCNLSLYLYVPSNFAKKYLSGMPTVKLCRDSKTWLVGIYYSGYFTRLTRRWISFARVQGLEEGDVCVFELINTNDATLKVSVFREIEGELKML